MFGHGNLSIYNIKDRLKCELEKHLNEPVNFLIGVHGDFDELALFVCRQLRKEFDNVEITVVFTSLNVLSKNNHLHSRADCYKDVNTIIYDIEEIHFKNRIVFTNKKMIEKSDLVICFVDMESVKSGAKTAVKYAFKINKPVVNLFREEDRPYYGMSKEEIAIDWENKKRKWGIGEQ